MDPLKQRFIEKAEALKNEVKSLLTQHGELEIDKVTVSQVFGGMRSIKSMIWEPSDLDAINGIKYRGYSIPELRDKLPKGPNSSEPMPEATFWLLLTGEIPTEEEAAWVSAEWKRRAAVPEHVFAVLDAMPVSTHPMTQLSAGVLAMQTDSIFAHKYDEGMSKATYWDPMYEDTMNLLARLPQLAAYIYRRSFHNGQHIAPDPSLDWSANYAHMLGYDHPEFYDLMRLYLTIHADHEGGNASAHTTHLVGSTLSDAYYSFAGGMTALAGPLHGLANQEVIGWIFQMQKDLGTTRPTTEQVRAYVEETLAKGQVIPGFGHAVLRQPDPRFIALKDFAERHHLDSDAVYCVWKSFEVVPPVLLATGKVKNPWPNVDCHSGALLVHYGLKEETYYTVMFGVSRAIGVLAALCWSRALGFPLERPKSLTINWVKEYIQKQQAVPSSN